MRVPGADQDEGQMRDSMARLGRYLRSARWLCFRRLWHTHKRTGARTVTAPAALGKNSWLHIEGPVRHALPRPVPHLLCHCQVLLVVLDGLVTFPQRPMRLAVDCIMH
jgi:hypothetical protein